MIKSKDITVVVQGNVIRQNTNTVARDGSNVKNTNWNEGLDITKECLNSIRKHLPDSKIVLSTYTGSNLDGLDYDELVLSEDPGAEGFIYPNQPNNINRIIKTSFEGLKKVDTEFCLKIRTDALLENADFLYIYNKWKDIKPTTKNAIFKNRVMANGLLTINTEKLPLPYTLNDWFFFGHTENLLYLFDIPLFDINSPKFIEKKKNIIKKRGSVKLDGLITPEQYVFVNALKKKFPNVSLNFHNEKGLFNKNLEKSKEFLLNNFVFIEGLNYGIIHKKNDEIFKNQMPHSYSYSNFCDSFSKFYNIKTPSISSKDITVVVQGLVDKDKTIKCLKSIKKYLPDATIIISTWEGCNIDHIEGLYNQVVFNKDPGATPHHDCENSILNNTNRQIVSSFNGIKEVKTRYTLKIRTDFYLTGNTFLSFFDKYNSFTDNLRRVRKKVLSCNLYARNPYHIESPFPFHPSDFVFFGLTEDVYNIFNIPLISDEDALYFKNREYPKVLGREYASLPRYFPEQYIWIKFLKYEELDYTVDADINNLIKTDISFANNLVILSLKQFCINSDKEGIFSYFPYTCYTHYDWLNLYAKYCNPNISINHNKQAVHHFIDRDIKRIKKFFFRIKRTEFKTIVKLIKIPVYHTKYGRFIANLFRINTHQY